MLEMDFWRRSARKSRLKKIKEKGEKTIVE